MAMPLSLLYLYCLCVASLHVHVVNDDNASLDHLRETIANETGTPFGGVTHRRIDLDPDVERATASAWMEFAFRAR